MDPEAWISDALADLERRSLLRRLAVRPGAGGKLADGGGEVLNFSSNDYLDLARRPEVVAAAVEAVRRYGAGATASRLTAGTLPVHAELERRLAAWKGYPAALVFGSGYLANAGIIPAVVGRGDTVFADRLVHASIVDGAVLSRAEVRRFRHNDAGHLDDLLRRTPAGGRRLVVTESVFSMDGDRSPLGEVAEAAARGGALLLVDEAHATGVFGPVGSGLGGRPGAGGGIHLSVGTLSKALGSSGGFVAASEAMRDLLVNRARSFIYSTAPPPAAMGAALGALDVLEREPDLGSVLLARAARFRGRLRAAGLDTLGSDSQIVPVRAGDALRALALADRLRSRGILAVAIRPPTVPEGTERIRFSVTLAHTEADLDRAAEAVIAAAREEGNP